jgi:hypothetical protein
MSGYQRKITQKNSMLAVANQKKKDQNSSTSHYMGTLVQQKRGETYRGSPTKF